jgi:hypothetical protein
MVKERKSLVVKAPSERAILEGLRQIEAAAEDKDWRHESTDVSVPHGGTSCVGGGLEDEVEVVVTLSAERKS